MAPQLTIYQASAGSGKTFTLAIEYIKLLIIDPTSYRNILAVTFTNKATEEMKERILSQLYGVAHQLPDSESYIRRITTDLGITPQHAAKQAGIALRNLIHDYSSFRVETIDTFFQTVLRNLARELELTANLRVGLNDVQVEEQAVDEMLDSLSRGDKMLQWIIGYIEQNMNDDKSWNVIGQIKSFGKTIFRDYYKKHGKELKQRIAEEGFFERYVRQLQAVRARSMQTMSGFSDRFDRILSQSGLSSASLKNGQRGIASYFSKLRTNDFSDKKCVNKTLDKHLESADEWVTKTNADRQIILSVVESQLLPLLEEAEAARPKQWRLYVSADLTLRHLNQLRLLGSIERKVRELNEEANRFLLSDTQQFLHDLIGQQDSPFIFEKMGTRLTHIMIDEFQDTSTVQWQNFKVLLEEAMSHAFPHQQGGKAIHNLIVGDVKQSIYRWRSGDWRLLYHINDQFAHPEERLQTVPLDTNYRSCRNIIDFNNAFFTRAAALETDRERAVCGHLADEILGAYAQVRQKVPNEKPAEGYVNITLLPAEDYDQATLDLMGKQVDEVMRQGGNAHRIAILVRKNKHIPVIADYFMRTRPTLHIVSDEAFQLDASLAVNTLVNALFMLARPADRLYQENVQQAFARIMMINGGTVSNDSEQEKPNPIERMTDDAHRNDYLHMPLMDLTERLFRELRLWKLTEESGYVCKFFDEVMAFVQDHGTDLEGFLRLWNDELHKKTIQSSTTDGIRLISIHKSKGLEFETVIIPYCDWRLEMGDTLWCQPTEEPFNALPIVPISYSSRLAESIYAADYAHEHLQTTVDNLNLLYVAFTRAARNLYVIGRKDRTDLRSQLIQDCLPVCHEDLCRLWQESTENASEEQPQATFTGTEQATNEDAPIEFCYGRLQPKSSENDKDATENVFLQPVEPLQLTVRPHTPHAVFRQSNQSKDFITSAEEEQYGANGDDKQRRQYIQMGNVMHSLFSRIRTTDDIPLLLQQMEQDGILYDESISRDRVEQLLKSRFSNKQVRDWFSSRWKLYNECSILTMDDDGRLVERRPDRVMTDGQQTIVVDFKFGSERAEYTEQVRQYMMLLQDMGHQQVRGYLWFVYSNTIKEVKI